MVFCFGFIFVSQHFFSYFYRAKHLKIVKKQQKTAKNSKKQQQNNKKVRKLISFFSPSLMTPFNCYLSKSFTQSLLNILSNPLSVKMQLRSRVIVIESQTQSKRIRTPSQKAIESKESKKALAAMDAQNLQQKLQQLRELQESQTPISKRTRTPSQKAIEAQENKTFMETLNDQEEEETQQSQNRYQTRSNKTPYSIAEFNQEFFNDASIAWRENKIQKPNATFQYRCSERLKNGNRCAKSPHDQFHCQKHTK